MPVVAAAQQTYEDQVKIVRINDSRRDVFIEFGVPTQPAWAFIDDDGSVDVHPGSFSEEELFSRIDALIAS